MPKEIIVPENVHPARGYSHAIKVGNTIYVAGQVALDEQGKLVGEGDVVAQIERSYENLRRVLEAAGATTSDVVRLNIYTRDMEGFNRSGEVRRRYFGRHYPGITVVAVQGLAIPGTLVEVEAIAVID